jgi:hypothetical protein
MESAQYLGRGMPIFVLLPMVLLGVLAIFRLSRKLPSSAGRMLVITIGMRPLLSAAWVFTFKSSPIGLSWNALSSIVFLAIGLMVLRRRSISPMIVLPILPLLAVGILSGTLNHALPDLATYVTKLGYLIVVALLTIEALEIHGEDKVMPTVILALLSPLIFQLVGTALGVVKQSESDGSAAYIGGFVHEAAFSVMLCGTLLAVCLARHVNFRVKLALIAWCSIGILIANYRTTLISIIPLLAITLLIGGTRQFIPRQRAIVGAMFVLLITASGLAIGVSQADRFSDLGVLISRNTSLIKPPGTFSIEERHIMSGRPLIWSQYYYAWEESSPRQHLIGLGPETWIGKMKVYAHNTLVSALFEVGLIGVACYIIIWIWFLGISFLVPTPARWICLAAHISFIILNMATMPMWNIEGLIYYALLCGYTVFMIRNRYRPPLRGGLPHFIPTTMRV